MRILILKPPIGAQNNLFQFLGECHTDCSDLFPTFTMIGISGQNRGDMALKTHCAFYAFIFLFRDDRRHLRDIQKSAKQSELIQSGIKYHRASQSGFQNQF